MHSRTIEARPCPRCTALREGLPFGEVMATAGGSAVAGCRGLQVLVVRLPGLAVLQAGQILRGRQRDRQVERVGPPSS